MTVRLNELLGTQANQKHAAAEAKVTDGAKAEISPNCAAPKLNCNPHGPRNALHQIYSQTVKTRGPDSALAKWLKPGAASAEIELMVLLKSWLDQA